VPQILTTASVPAVQAIQTWASAGGPAVYRFFLDLVGSVKTLIASVNTAITGTAVFTLATQPALAAGDAGFLGFVGPPYNHFVTWDGAKWLFTAPDWGPGAIAPFAVPPQPAGWQACDGTATDYLVVGGATLTTAPFTTPNLNGTPSYIKSAAIYSGALNPASGVTAAGATGTGVTGTGTTGNESAHTHNVPGAGILTTGNEGSDQTVQAGVGVTVAADPHQHQVTVPGVVSGPGSPHNHTVPSLTVPSLTVPALGVGSLDVPSLGCPHYFRR
jgi:hypothetical protein